MAASTLSSALPVFPIQFKNVGTPSDFPLRQRKAISIVGEKGATQNSWWGGKNEEPWNEEKGAKAA